MSSCWVATVVLCVALIVLFKHERHFDLDATYEWHKVVKQTPGSVFRPEVYHPPFFSGNYFEGWYFKFVTPNQEESLVVIIGIFLAEENANYQTSYPDNFQEGDHGFIMIYHLDKKASSPLYEYIRFEMDEVELGTQQFSGRFGKNIFSEHSVTLDIKQGKLSVSGKVDLVNTKPWPISYRFPGVMGWFEYFPFLECYHGVVSLDHDLIGEVSINNKKLLFGTEGGKTGKGYIEKDRGSNFPVSWVWVQSNLFDSPSFLHTNSNVSFFLSLAPVPITPFYQISGILMGFLLNDKLYAVTTYTGGSVEYVRVDNSTDQAEVSLSLGDTCTKIELHLKQSLKGSVVLLHAPSKTGMERRVNEHLGGELWLRVWDLCSSKDQKKIFEGSSETAAFELVGGEDLEKLGEALNS